MNDVAITLRSGKVLRVPYGTTVSDLFEGYEPGSCSSAIVAALVNNELASVTYKLKFNSMVEPVMVDTPEGIAAYRRSLCFVLTIAARDLFPGKTLIIGHSLGDGYFYHFQEDETIEAGDLRRLDRKSVV